MSNEAGTPRYLSLVVPLKKVGDEVVHKKLGDRMERAATTASSLEVEQDSASFVDYALTVNPTIYTSCIEQFWATSKVKTVNDVRQIQALIDKKRLIITETSIRSDLHLEDAEGTDCLPTAIIFEELARMGYEKLSQKQMPGVGVEDGKTSQRLTFYKAFFSPQWKFLIHTITQCLSAKSTAWNEFSSTKASTIICLATNQKFNLSKYIFDTMLDDMSHHKKIYVNPSHTKKIFANMKREGKDFSGRIQQKKKGIFISQDKYVNEILRKYNYTYMKSASTPTDLEKPLVQDGDAVDVDEHLYRSMIGSLMYLTASRPDIMFAVCACARFQVSPKISHLLAVKRIFRYLKGKPSLGLWYSKDSPLELVAYTDSDYAGATQDRKSTTGGCQFLGNRLISWQCKKQTVVATSTTEAEYVAAASCCGQVLWIQNQLLDYGYNFMNTVIYIDNNSTICIIENPVQHSKTKHIEIRHHFIRDCNAKKLIQMAKIDTEHNVADLLTKGFDAGRFQYLVSSIGMLNP
ncbi:hypothetical protein Tco_0698721 [Tanacetum coccineum]